jgi:hypothetical protein
MLPDLQAQPRPSNAQGFGMDRCAWHGRNLYPDPSAAPCPAAGRIGAGHGVIAASVLAGRKLERGNAGQGSPENEIGFDAL